MSLPLSLDPGDIIPLGRPGRTEPDFVFYPKGVRPIPFYGVIELKRPDSQIITVPRHNIAVLTRNAATAIAQAQEYSNMSQFLPLHQPDELLFIGNRSHLFVIMGMSRQFKLQIHADMIQNKLPQNLQIVPYDTLFTWFSAKVPPQLYFLVQSLQHKFYTIILAASLDMGMKSNIAKALHPVCGKPMVSYVVEAAKKAGSAETLIVVGYQAEMVKEKLRDENLIFIFQEERLGTGHAVIQAREWLEDYAGIIVILYGDVPLLKPSTLKYLLDCHRKGKSGVTFLTTIVDDPTGYGRVVRGQRGEVLRIVEESDATSEEKKIQEINTGIYCVESTFLFKALLEITNQNAKQEYYLTDIIAIAYTHNKGVDARVVHDHSEVMGINTLVELEQACSYVKT